MMDIVKYCDEIDQALLDIANGKIKANKLPLEPIVRLSAYARQAQAEKAELVRQLAEANKEIIQLLDGVHQRSE